MSKYHRTATYKDGLLVLNNLRKEDLEELRGTGSSPLHVPFGVLISEHATFFHDTDGSPAGIAGVVRLSPTEGQIWMLCTPEIYKYPVSFARKCKRFVDSRPEKMLWNICDKRNTVHLKLLKFLGFKFLREVNYGPNNVTFIEFCRVRTSNSTDSSQWQS